MKKFDSLDGVRRPFIEDIEVQSLSYVLNISPTHHHSLDGNALHAAFKAWRIDELSASKWRISNDLVSANVAMRPALRGTSTIPMEITFDKHYPPHFLDEFRIAMANFLGRRSLTEQLDSKITRMTVAFTIQGVSLDNLLVHIDHAKFTHATERRVGGRNALDLLQCTQYPALLSGAEHDFEYKMSNLRRSTQSQRELFSVNATSVPYRAGPVKMKLVSGRMKSTSVSDLLEQQCPFSYLQLTAVLAEGLDPDGTDFWRKIFLAMCKQHGYEAAVHHFKQKRQVQERILADASATSGWWNPEKVWQQATLHVRNINLFDDPALNAFPNR